MKQVIISAVCVSAILSVLAIQSVVDGRTSYVQELEDALSVSVSQTMKEVMEQDSFGIEDRNEFIAAFLQALILRTNSDVDMTVCVISADIKNGILDIEVKERFNFLNTREQEISLRRTVIFEKKDQTAVLSPLPG